MVGKDHTIHTYRQIHTAKRSLRNDKVSVLETNKEMLKLILASVMGFPGGSDNKESTCNARDLGSILGLGRSPGRGHGNPLQYSCLGNLHGQRSLAGYSPPGHKESDTTERLSTAQYSKIIQDQLSMEKF